MKKKQKGFSLIELLIVVAIILIIAAIAIPNLLRSRMAANEASAVGSVRTINTAAISYNSTYGNGFPPTLAAIGTASGAVSCTNAQLIDSVLSSGTKSGYTFTFSHGAAAALTSASSSCSGGYGYPDGYTTQAAPVTIGTTGQRGFCSDASGVIRFNTSGTTTITAPNCTDTNVLQ